MDEELLGEVNETLDYLIEVTESKIGLNHLLRLLHLKSDDQLITLLRSRKILNIVINWEKREVRFTKDEHVTNETLEYEHSIALRLLQVGSNSKNIVTGQLAALKELVTANSNGNDLHLIDEMTYSCVLRQITLLELKKFFSILPSSIATMSNLLKLGIQGNGVKELPSSIGDLTNLMALNAAYNQLVHLPSSLCRLNKLIVMNLSHNKLTRLPENIGNLKNLEHLDLMYNPLEDIPDSLAHLTITNIYLDKRIYNLLSEEKKQRFKHLKLHLN